MNTNQWMNVSRLYIPVVFIYPEITAVLFALEELAGKRRPLYMSRILYFNPLT